MNYLLVERHQVLLDQSLKSFTWAQSVGEFKLCYFDERLQEYIERHEWLMLVDSTEYQIDPLFVHQRHLRLLSYKFGGISYSGESLWRLHSLGAHYSCILKHFMELC